jgi:hypothetical protein
LRHKKIDGRRRLEDGPQDAHTTIQHNFLTNNFLSKMPNWCENTLDISGSENDIQDFKSRMTKEHNGEKQIRFADLLPTPQQPDVDWYSWQVEHWGTKWDLDDSQETSVDTTVIYSVFQTAWSPPEEWLAHAAATFPNLRFTLTYDEPGCDFGGVIEYEDGTCQNHTQGRSPTNEQMEAEEAEEEEEEEAAEAAPAA